jgi:hypothetical protein
VNLRDKIHIIIDQAMVNGRFGGDKGWDETIEHFTDKIMEAVWDDEPKR